jgi:hypothetical protein
MTAAATQSDGNRTRSAQLSTAGVPFVISWRYNSGIVAWFAKDSGAGFTYEYE